MACASTAVRDLGAERATRPSRTPIPPPGPAVPWSVYRGGRTLRGQPGHQGVPDGKKQNVLQEGERLSPGTKFQRVSHGSPMKGQRVTERIMI